MTRTPDAMLAAGRASHIPNGERGLWVVESLSIAHRIPSSASFEIPGFANPQKPIPPGDYTRLGRMTDATMHVRGETVMIDHIHELRTHLDFARRARGDVLVTGLGLGCVVRMLRCNDRVNRITVVEKCKDVIDLVAPHLFRENGGDDGIEIVHADVFDYFGPDLDRHWDFAWHDLWTDTAAGEPHLAVVHARLFMRCLPHCGWQWAWAFPKEQASAMRAMLKLARRRIMEANCGQADRHSICSQLVQSIGRV